MASSRTELYHSLSVMLGAGVPLLKSLQLAATTARGRLGRGFLEVAEAASRGEALTAAMARLPDVFPPLDVLVFEVAETSGRLPESLERLSQYYAFRDRLGHVIGTGLVLPVLIFHIAALVIPLPPLVLASVTLGYYLLEVSSILALL